DASDPTILQIIHHAHVELARFCNDVSTAQEHAAKMDLLGQRHSFPYFHAVAANCRGIVKGMAQNDAGAITDFAEALSLVRSGGVAREHETEILANIAECHRRLGNARAALDYARETISLSQSRTTRLAECRALITAAAAMLELNEPALVPASGQALASARVLLDVTGGQLYEAEFASVVARWIRIGYDARSPESVTSSAAGPAG
ncbi:MAG: hypothetical protein Q8N51_03370, partial [Gammaproteobacteria bacterium]|nr:hypothetical protein [Gammaproteobacteria bacterium]